MKKIVALMLVLVSIFTVASTSLITASAANATVAEVKNIIIKNVKTGQYLNYDYGTLKNGTPLRVWPKDGSKEQLFAIDNVKGDTYRILTNASSKYSVDVYRGNAKLKAGQLCDIWKTGDDTTAQNVVFYKCDDGSYIIRMAANTNLALAAPSAKGRVKLAKFSTTDKSQRWIFQDKNGKAIDGFMAVAPLANPLKYPGDYIMGGSVKLGEKEYWRVLLDKKVGNLPVGTEFFIEMPTHKIVVDETFLNELLVICNYSRNRYGSIYNELKEIILSTCDYVDEYTNIKGYKAIGPLVGKGAAAFAKSWNTVTNGGSFADCAKSFGSLFEEAGKKVADVDIQIVLLFSKLCIQSGLEAFNITGENDRETITKAIENYAWCKYNFEILKAITLDTIEEYNQKPWYDKVLDGALDATEGMAEDVMGEYFNSLEDVDKVKTALVMAKTLKTMSEMQDKGDEILDFMKVGKAAKKSAETAYAQTVAKYLVPDTKTLLKNTKIIAASGNKYVAPELIVEVEALKETYPEGTRKTSLFERANAWQCHGFACEALMDFWDTAKPTPKNKNYTYYKATSKESYVSKIRPGDMVRYNVNEDFDHTIVITNVDNTYVYYADCNADGKCTFKYNKKMKKTDLANKLKRIVVDQDVSTRGYVCHYKNNTL